MVTLFDNNPLAMDDVCDTNFAVPGLLHCFIILAWYIVACGVSEIVLIILDPNLYNGWLSNSSMKSDNDEDEVVEVQIDDSDMV